MAAKEKCETCKMHFQGFHICIPPDQPLRLPRKTQVPTAANIEASRTAQKERWEKVWASNKKRDEKILELYTKEFVGLVDLGKRFGLSKTQVNRIIRRMGGTIRPRWYNHKKEKVNG